MNTKLIIKLYREDHLTIRQIASQLNCGYETVRKILIDNNVQWKRKYISDFSDEQIQDIINLYQNAITIKLIASKYGISAPAVSRLLKSNGIEVISNTHKYDDLRTIHVNDVQKQLLVGSLLGDACLYQDTEKSNYKLSFGHCEGQREYFNWKVSTMKPFVTCFRRYMDKRGNSVMWQTATISHPDFNEFGLSFYDQNRIKHIPTNLKNHFTSLALATWIMDDGNLNEDINMRIATMSFTEKENYLLQSYLYDLFNLKSKVMPYNEKHFQLCLDKTNTQKLSDIIRPYVVPCMLYKIM
jgi:hypothetical protein